MGAIARVYGVQIRTSPLPGFLASKCCPTMCALFYYPWTRELETGESEGLNREDVWVLCLYEIVVIRTSWGEPR